MLSGLMATMLVLSLAVAVAGAADKRSPARRVAPGKSEPLLVPLALEQLITVDQTLAGQEGKVLALAYGPDGVRLASGDDDKTLNVWNVRTGQAAWTMKELPDKVTALCFSGDGSVLATAGRDKEVLLWDAAKGAFLAGLRVPDDVRSLACSPKGMLLAAALDDRSVVLWDLARLETVPAAPTAQDRPAEGNRLVNWFKKLPDRKKEQIQAASDQAMLKVLRHDRAEALSLAFSPDGALLATGGKNGQVLIWDVRQGVVAYTLEGAEKDLLALGFSPDGGQLAAIEDKKRLVLWEVKGSGPPRVTPATRDDILALSISADGTLLAAAGKKRVTLWSLATLKDVYTFPEQEKDLLTVQFDPVGGHLATGGEDKQVRLWSVPGILTLLGRPDHGEEISALEQERDGKIRVLAAPRGEFETSREYEARLKRAKAEETLIRKEYEGRIRASQARRDEELARMRRQLYPYTVRVDLGNYNADQGTFAVRVGEQQIFVPVPVDRAREMARHREKSVIAGMIRYHTAERAELVNAALLNPESGEHFPFGSQVADTAETGQTDRGGRETTARRALPQLAIGSVSLAEPSGNGALDAGESGTVKVTLKNEGRGPAEGVLLGLLPIGGGTLPRGIQLAEKTFVGSVAPGESRTLEVEIVAGEEVASQEVRLQVTALETDGFDSRPVAMAFAARAMVPPDLQVAKVDISDADGRRIISKGKEVNLTLAVRNAGHGPAREITAGIEVRDPNIVLFGDPQVSLGTLKPGETKQATFTVAVTQRYAGGKTLPIAFAIGEARPRFAVHPTIRLALDEQAPEMRLVRIETKDASDKGAELDDVSAAPLFAVTRRVFTDRDLAVVVGIERYQSLPKSDYAYNDARGIKSYLLSLGFAERNIEFLVDERATLSALRKSVESWLPNRVKKGSRIFFYYSGHGAPDPASGEAYLVPYDGDPGYLADTGYPVKRLYEKLGAAKAEEVIVVMDSCFSGSGGRSVLAKGARPLVLTGEGPAIPQRMAVLASTQGSQISTSFQEKEHGVFTYYFLRAIKDGKRDLNEIYQFVKPLVEDTAKSQNVNQSPVLNLGGDGSTHRYQLLKE